MSSLSLIPISDLAINPPQPEDYVVFGGSFDPPHEGHLTIIRSALSFFKRLILAPTAENPWKDFKPVPLDARVQMLNILLKAEKIPIADSLGAHGVSISTLAYKYSEELVVSLRTQFSGNQYWVVGEDSKDSVTNWRNWDKLGVPVLFAPVIIQRHSTDVRQNSLDIHPAIRQYAVERGLYGYK